MIKFRRYKDSDEPMLRGMLMREKIPFGLMQHENKLLDRWVMEEDGVPTGFYAWNTQHERAAIVHFVVDKRKRTNERARALGRHLKETLRRHKLTGILVAIPDTNVGIFKFIKYYFKNPWAYAVKGPLMFVRAEV
jgi:hypothetical protein